MKTYSKAEVAEVIRDVLRGKVDVESVEHVDSNEFSLTIVIGEASGIPVIPVRTYERFLDSFAAVLGQRFDSEGTIWSTGDKMEYLERKSGYYWTRQITIFLKNIKIEG